MTNLFFLIMPLVGGYLFLSTWNVTRYKTIRIAGYSLFFLSAFVGIVLLVIAKFLVKFLLLFNYSNLMISFISDWFIPTRFDLESMMALVVGIGFPFLFNLFSDKHKFAKIAAKDRGDSLHLMIYKAIENEQPIELMMQNGKVYIGLVMITGDLFNEYVIVTPYFSGYRDEKTNELVITNNYRDAQKEMTKKENSSRIEIEHPDLNVTLKMNDVATAQVFYPEIYAELEKLSMKSMA